MALLPLDFLYRYVVLFLLKMALLTLDIFAQNVLCVTTEMSSVLNQKCQSVALLPWNTF